jgi:hypothetical protein
MISASGPNTARAPLAMAAAACWAETLPLKESGATTTTGGREEHMEKNVSVRPRRALWMPPHELAGR